MKLKDFQVPRTMETISASYSVNLPVASKSGFLAKVSVQFVILLGQPLNSIREKQSPAIAWHQS